jgi:exodeoxyribonuclease VII small subunit
MAKSTKNNADSESADNTPSFEESLSHLDQIVNDLEGGSLGLEESLARFENAVGLLRGCYRLLENAEQRIDVLLGFDDDGNPVVTPFDASATLEETKPPVAGRRKKQTRATKKPATTEAEENADSDEDSSSKLF